MGWNQVTLPVRAGSLGVRRAVEQAPSAYLVSAAGCFEFISQILLLHLAHMPDQNIPADLALWSEGHSQPPPSGSDSGVLAASHSSIASTETGAVAAEAEWRKKQKYSHLNSSHHFIPVAVETLGVFGCEAHTFFRDISRHILSVTQDPMAHQYLIQRVAVVIQRGNAAAVLRTISGGT